MLTSETPSRSTSSGPWPAAGCWRGTTARSCSSPARSPANAWRRASSASRKGVAHADTVDVLDAVARPPCAPTTGAAAAATTRTSPTNGSATLKAEIDRRRASAASDACRWRTPPDGDGVAGARLPACGRDCTPRRGRLGFFREGTHALCDAAATGQLSPATVAWLAAAQAALAPHARRRRSLAVELAENVPASQRAVHVEVRGAVDARALAPLGGRTDGPERARRDVAGGGDRDRHADRSPTTCRSRTPSGAPLSRCRATSARSSRATGSCSKRSCSTSPGS